jgi:saccharopine dehydrogenase-like NADP-dependent oxidoreductase
MKIFVLGAGMVGKAIAYDLSVNHNVTSADIDQNALIEVAKYGVNTIQADLSDYSSIPKLVAESDLVVSAVPGFMGYRTVESLIKAGKDVVDISFMPEDFMELSSLAIQNNVTVIADCGVAPGMPNFILGHYNQLMQITDFFYMVGGLPKARNFPFQYKAPFSPVDVLEEYTRPARCVENGVLTTKPALSDPEYFRFDGIGDLEGFNTDGLRSILNTMNHIPNMKEKTLRYPGHISIIQALKSTGFFDTDAIDFHGKSIVPIEFTSKILFNDWKLKPNEPEFTVMRVILSGMENGKRKTITYDLYDEYDDKTQQWSMARTTGYTATAAVNLIADGLFRKKGVFPPELVGCETGCFSYVVEYLKNRNVNYQKTEKFE